MPIYEYACTACGAECEVLQRLSDEPERVCPSCGAEALVKEVSAAGFRLKGSGWYETDFKSEGKHNLVTDERTAKPEAKSDSTSDTPAVAKADAPSDKSAKSAGGDEAKSKPMPKPATPPAKPAKNKSAALDSR